MYGLRIQIFLILVTLGMLALMGRLVQLQIVRAETYRQEAAANLVRSPNLLDARRGAILDRTGRRLAEDVPQFDLCIYYPALAIEDEGFLRRKAARERRTLDDVRREMQPFWLTDRRLDRALGRMSDRLSMSDEEFVVEIADLWPTLAAKSQRSLDVLDECREKILRTVAETRNRVQRDQGRETTIREETYGVPGSVPHVLVEGLNDQTKAALASLEARWPFLEVREHTHRRYSYGKLAAHVLGYLGQIGEDDVGHTPEQVLGSSSGGSGSSAVVMTPAAVLEATVPPPNAETNPAKAQADELRAYRLGDLRGREGLEAKLEPLLRGRRGLEHKRRNGAAGEAIEPVPGQDVVLTLDAVFQSDVEALLDDPPAALPENYGAPRGAAVVIDLRTSGILALASTPRYDPNTFFVDYPDLLSNTATKPLIHRAIAAQLSLGSIYKIITTTAALQEYAITPHTAFTCRGVLDTRFPDQWRCLGTHGEIELERALRVSCNIYFYNVGMKLGSERLTEWGRRFGLGERVGLPLTGEAKGLLRDGEKAPNLAIGQGALMVTPIQMARVAALVATGGRMNEIHLLQSPAPPVQQVDLGISPQNAAFVRQALAGVVNEPDGTGYRLARSTLVRIAGKTGSAQMSGNKPTHSWFVGYAPAERPQIAFAVVFENAGHGGEVSGPVAREIVESALRRGLIGGSG